MIIMKGKNKDILRKMFESKSGKKALTKKGIKTKEYERWLKKNTTPHWMSAATELFKFESQLVAGEITFTEAKKQAREITQLKEACMITPAIRIKLKLKEFENRFSRWVEVKKQDKIYYDKEVKRIIDEQLAK